MKLSELKPCAACGGPLMKPPAGCWYVVRVSTAIVNPAAARQVMGLSMMFGGAMGLAEAMAPQPEKAVLIVGDEEPSCMSEFHLCLDCVPTELLGLIERQSDEKAAKAVPA